SYALSGLPVTVRSLTPGAAYAIRLQDNRSWLSTPGWTKVKTHCDCNLNSQSNGAPKQLTVIQRKGVHKLSWVDNSACDTSFTVKRNGVSVQSYLHEGVFGADLIEYSNDELFNLQVDPVGSDIQYCVQAIRGDINYGSSVTCVTQRVYWIGLLDGRLQTAQG